MVIEWRVLSNLQGTTGTQTVRPMEHPLTDLEAFECSLMKSVRKDSECAYKRNTEARSLNQCCRGKAVLHILRVYL
jgi:hypothetical protein